MTGVQLIDTLKIFFSAVTISMSLFFATGFALCIVHKYCAQPMIAAQPADEDYYYRASFKSRKVLTCNDTQMAKIRPKKLPYGFC